MSKIIMLPLFLMYSTTSFAGKACDEEWKSLDKDYEVREPLVSTIESEQGSVGWIREKLEKNNCVSSFRSKSLRGKGPKDSLGYCSATKSTLAYLKKVIEDTEASIDFEFNRRMGKDAYQKIFFNKKPSERKVIYTKLAELYGKRVKKRYIPSQRQFLIGTKDFNKNCLKYTEEELKVDMESQGKHKRCVALTEDLSKAQSNIKIAQQDLQKLGNQQQIYNLCIQRVIERKLKTPEAPAVGNVKTSLDGN